jgi:hypothetical protein
MVSDVVPLVMVRILPGEEPVKERLGIQCRTKEWNRTRFAKQIKKEDDTSLHNDRATGHNQERQTGYSGDRGGPAPPVGTLKGMEKFHRK